MFISQVVTIKIVFRREYKELSRDCIIQVACDIAKIMYVGATASSLRAALFKSQYVLLVLIDPHLYRIVLTTSLLSHLSFNYPPIVLNILQISVAQNWVGYLNLCSVQAAAWYQGQCY